MEPSDVGDVPNIRGRYPLDGTRIGPAWRAAWHALEGGDWVGLRVLSLELAPQHGLTPQAVASVLTQAAGARLLERRVRPDGRLIELRRADVPDRAAAAPTRPHIEPPRIPPGVPESAKRRPTVPENATPRSRTTPTVIT